MTYRALACQLAAYLAAGTVTAIAAFLASIPITDRLALIGLTADAAVLVGWPALLAADALAELTPGGAA